MCVIIIKKESKALDEDVLKTSAEINPDGLGVVWLDNYEITYHNSEQYKVLKTERPFIAHFRYATRGAVNRSNVHPFQCGNNKSEYLMQNGTIRNLGTDKDCDTKILAQKLGKVRRKKWGKLLRRFDSRFVSINTKYKNYQIYNRHLFVEKDGVLYSKPNVLLDNMVAVYGTLKRKHSNHHHYLDDYNFVSSGKTKDKYPLIDNGLPYVINDKGHGHNIEVDVFKVSNQTLQELDLLEKHPDWYRREKVPIILEDGREMVCWLYFNPKTSWQGKKLLKSYNEDKRWNHIWDWGYSGSTYRDYLTIDESYYAVEDKKYWCEKCYSDLEYDQFNQYYCNQCNTWYSESQLKEEF